MQLRHLHPWDVSPAEAAAIQARLAPQVIAEGGPQNVRCVAGADIAFLDRPRGRQPSLARGAVVLLSYPHLRVLEHHVIEHPVTFPYVPGLLAFREVPVLARAFELLDRPPDLLLVDGHGLSHPRRFGIASHLGLLLDVPTIGVAKSRLVGEHSQPPMEAGGRAELRDGPELIGIVLRTRQGGAPIYVSVGHRIGLEEAAAWVLRLCCAVPAGSALAGGQGQVHRLPEPARLADQLSKGRPLPVAAPRR